MFDTRSEFDRAPHRRSLLTLGGAVLAKVMSAPRTAEAGKESKKAKKRVKRTCQRQIGACRAFFTELCAADPDCDEEEMERVFPCCELLANCKAGDSVACFFELVA
jgi:hypothetical protein